MPSPQDQATKAIRDAVELARQTLDTNRAEAESADAPDHDKTSNANDDRQADDDTIVVRNRRRPRH